jgi:PAS domain S-box-containing protein
MPKQSAITLLLVEDEPLIALTEKRSLEKYGYTVFHVSTGEAAVAAMDAEPEIDMILMDIDLGSGIDGTEAAEKILADHAVPVVFVSSHSEREIVEKTERITSYGYVVKNSSITVLDASIKMAFKLFEEKKRSRSILGKLEATLDAIPDLMFVVDAEGYFRDFHAKSTSTSLAMPSASILGSHLHDIFPPEEVAVQLALYHTCIATGTIQTHSYTLEIDGAKNYFSLQLSRFDKDQVLAIIHDVTKQKQIEQEKQEIAERLSFACEAGGIGIWEYDVAEKSLRWDKQVYGLFGTRQECHANAAEAWATIVHPDDKATSEQSLARCLQQEQDYDDMFRIVWADGSLHDIHSIAKIQRDASGAARSFIGINYEITSNKNAERQLGMKNEELEIVNEELCSTTEELKKQNEELLIVKDKLQESEATYRSFITASPDNVIISDLDGRILFVSPMTLKLLQCRESDLTGQRIMDFLLPGERRRAAANMIHMFQHVSDGLGEYHAIRSDGGIVDVEVNAEFIRDAGGNPDKILYMARDITERKRHESSLKESEQRLKFVLEGARLGYWDWDLRTNRILRNEQWATMLGYSLAELEDNIEQGIALQHPDDREITWRSIHDHLEGRTDLYRSSYRLRMKDGSYKWILDCGKVMERDERGQPVRLCGTHTDIDEQKKSDEKIRHLLAEKEIVLKEVHHRIKNNMSTMRSLLTLQAGNNKDPRAREALDDAGKRMRSMECLYDKLYRADNFSLLSTTAYLPQLIDDIIGNFPDSRLVNVEKRIQDFDLDAKRLQPLGIVVNELLANCMKYAFAGRDSGVVTVTVGLCEGLVSISVKDDGIGIPESIALDDATGFGFQLVQALAYQLQGTVRLERDAGTNIVLEFRK